MRPSGAPPINLSDSVDTLDYSMNESQDLTSLDFSESVQLTSRPHAQFDPSASEPFETEIMEESFASSLADDEDGIRPFGRQFSTGPRATASDDPFSTSGIFDSSISLSDLPDLSRNAQLQPVAVVASAPPPAARDVAARGAETDRGPAAPGQITLQGRRAGGAAGAGVAGPAPTQRADAAPEPAPSGFGKAAMSETATAAGHAIAAAEGPSAIFGRSSAAALKPGQPPASASAQPSAESGSSRPAFLAPTPQPVASGFSSRTEPAAPAMAGAFGGGGGGGSNNGGQSRDRGGPAAAGVDSAAAAAAAAAALSAALAAQRDAHERELDRLQRAHTDALARGGADVDSAASARARLATTELEQRVALLQQRLDLSDASHAQAVDGLKAVHEAQLQELRAAAEQAAEQRARHGADALLAEQERSKQQMQQAHALLESALRAQEKNHAAALDAARHSARDEAERTRAQLAAELDELRRAQRVQLEQAERTFEATLAAAERRSAEAAASTAQLHRAQLAAIGHVNGETQQLSALAALVHSSADSLGALQTRVEQETWKAVLKSEKAQLDKERALQEVEARRERAFAEREAIVGEMQRELKLEAGRHQDVWTAAQRGWTDLQEEHGTLRASLASRQLELVALGERAQGALDELLVHIAAERSTLGQERAMLREERRTFTGHVLEHRKDVAAQRDKLYAHQQELAGEHAVQLQRSLNQQRAVDDERTTLHARERSAEYERSLAAKERAALGEYMSTLQHEFVESASERSRLQTVSESLAQRTRAISLLHKEMTLERDKASSAHSLAEREAADARQKSAQLERSARTVLRASFGGDVQEH
jgi:hypothetical protein